MSALDLLARARPFLWLALAAFLAGFLSYLAVGGPRPLAGAQTAAYIPLAHAPSSDEWNLPKRV
jgi:hypothetical protein